MNKLEENVRLFLAELDDIDFENIEYFIFRKPIVREDIRDRLKNHISFEIECGKAYFGFTKQSDLPHPIRKRCILKFIYFFEDGVILNGVS